MCESSNTPCAPCAKKSLMEAANSVNLQRQMGISSIVVVLVAFLMWRYAFKTIWGILLGVIIGSMIGGGIGKLIYPVDTTVYE